MTPRSPLFVNDSACVRTGLPWLYALRGHVEARTRDLGSYTLGWALWSAIFLRGGSEERSRVDRIFSAWDEAQARMPKRKEDG